ncbi:MAG: ribosomal RNA small subunit methyltransferase A [Proteobacteria bacterium]|nr:MAG: ribosomal RNA small subunit methyltransferase A [Pseudomonadota bacterium]
MSYDRDSHIRQKKSLSQVFLKTDWPVIRVAEGVEEWNISRILEIGPGGGILTRALMGKPWKLTAVEKDDRFVEKLTDYFNVSKEMYAGQFRIVNEDVLKFDLGAWLRESQEPTAIVGNIPYAISSSIVLWLLPYLQKVKGVKLLVQLEFAQRLAAVAGTKDYGSLSVYTQLRSQVNIDCKVERTCFTPVPKVDSAIITLKPRADVLDDELLRKVEKVCRACFTQRRKKLRNSVKQFVGEDRLEDCPIDLNRRPDAIRPEEYLELARYIYNI